MPIKVIGDQIEQEVGGEASDAPMFGLAHGAMLLAPSECTRSSPIATSHIPDATWFVRRWRCCGLPVFVTAWFSHVASPDGAKIGDMLGDIVRLVLIGRDAVAYGLVPQNIPDKFPRNR